MEISWRRSYSDSGGGSVTDFQVQIRMQGGDWRNCSHFLSNDTCFFNGLLTDNNETPINIRVRALNRMGFSNWTNRTFFIDRVGK